MRTRRAAQHAMLSTALMAVFAAAATAAEPAMVSMVSGNDLQWQSGDKIRVPRVQSLLAAGDVISAGKGSVVVVDYLADGCSVSVKPGNTLTIGETSPCAVGKDGRVQTVRSPAVASVITPAEADPVEISGTKGPITRMNKGDGLVEAQVGASLQPGDEVFAGPGSAVTLFFAMPGCFHTVAASSVYKITSKAPCWTAVPAQDSSASLSEEGDAPVALIAGGVSLASIIALVTSTSEGGNDGGNGSGTPATPD